MMLTFFIITHMMNEIAQRLHEEIFGADATKLSNSTSWIMFKNKFL